MVFFPPGKSYVFLWNFKKALLEILMCSSTFCLSWKIYMSSYAIFGSPGKLDVCSYKIIMSFSWKIHMFFLLPPSLLENLMRSLKKSAASAVL